MSVLKHKASLIPCHAVPGPHKSLNFPFSPLMLQIQLLPLSTQLLNKRHEKRKRANKYYILTHPCFWHFQGKEENPTRKLNRY